MTKTANEFILNSKQLIPEVVLVCPNCRVQFNTDAIYRIYRTFLLLTRHSRATNYTMHCSVCGKLTKVRVKPEDEENYKCKQCITRIEADKKRGYKRNPLASQKIE